MKIITISREFGSGGRELGKRVAELLGFDYYDREIITTIAERQGLDPGYVETALENHGWKTIPLTVGRTFSNPIGLQAGQTRLLVEQKRVIEGISKTGRDCVIVGRNADVLLREEHPFRLFVCADMETKVRRCIARAEGRAPLSPKEIERNARRIDKNRAQTCEMISGSTWGARENYQLMINTTGWSIGELAPMTAEFAKTWFGRTI